LLRGTRIVVVDDESDGCMAVAALLTIAGAQVRTAAGGREALEVIRTWWPTLLVSDLAMPAGDGYELIRAVRSLRGGTALPAVVLSGAATAEDRERTRAAGFNVHLAKPVDPDELVGVLAQLARTPRAVRAPEH
jgi:CheY-like chemotaxis protein